jgi:hypothetical protein
MNYNTLIGRLNGRENIADGMNNGNNHPMNVNVGNIFNLEVNVDGLALKVPYESLIKSSEEAVKKSSEAIECTKECIKRLC